MTSETMIEAAAKLYARIADVEKSAEDTDREIRAAFPDLTEQDKIVAWHRAIEIMRSEAAESRLTEKLARRAGCNDNALLINLCDQALQTAAYEYAAEKIARGEPQPSQAELERHVRERFLGGVSDEEVADALAASALMFEVPDHPLHEFVRYRRQVLADVEAAERTGIDLSWPVMPAAHRA